MTSFEMIALVLLAMTGLAIVVGAFLRNKVKEKELVDSERIFSFWAAMGPFKSGQDSANAMRAAHQAILGPRKASKVEEGLSKHAAAFDSNPKFWEQTRKETLQNSDQPPKK